MSSMKRARDIDGAVLFSCFCTYLFLQSNTSQKPEEKKKTDLFDTSGKGVMAHKHVATPHPRPSYHHTLLAAEVTHHRLVCRLPSASSRRRNSLNPLPGADLNTVPHRLDGGQQGAGGSTKQSRSFDLVPRARITTKSHQMMSAGCNVSASNTYILKIMGRGVGSEACESAANQRLRALRGGAEHVASIRSYV